MSTINLLSLPNELLSPVLQYALEGEGNLRCRQICTQVKDFVDLYLIPSLWKKLKEDVNSPKEVSSLHYISRIKSILKKHIEQIKDEAGSIPIFQKLNQEIIKEFRIPYKSKYAPLSLSLFLKMEETIFSNYILINAWPSMSKDLSPPKTLKKTNNADGMRAWLEDNSKALSDVDRLKLDALNLEIIPSEVNKYFTNVTYINLSYNNLKQAPDLSNLTKLTQLDLGGGKSFNGDVGPNEIKSLGTLTNLTQLHYLLIRRNQLTTLEGLEKLTQLQYLEISENPITSLEPLSNLTRLTVLKASKIKTSDLQPLSNLTSLESLHFEGNNCSNFGWLLTKLTKLQWHYFGNTY